MFKLPYREYYDMGFKTYMLSSVNVEHNYTCDAYM